MSKQQKNMIMILVGVILISGVITGIIIWNARCVLDGTQICYDENNKVFYLEEDAKVSVQVESDSLKQYLEETWITLHPEYEGALEITVRDSLTLDELAAEGLPFDLNVTGQTSAAFIMDKVFDMGSAVGDTILANVPTQLQDASNASGIVFVPNSTKGWLFVYNKTFAEELGYDLTDEDLSGLPDIFESWEDIIEFAPQLLEQMDTVFPLTFVDQESFYPFLTGGRWLLNFTNRGSDPGFGSSEFLDGLALIEALRDAPIVPMQEDGTVSSAESLAWRYEEALYNRETLFTIAIDWMQLDEHSALTGDEYVYAPFPSFKGTRLSPMAEVDGYVMSKDVEYPSATAEVLRILRAPAAASVYSSASSKTFVMMRHEFQNLQVDDETLNKIRAYSYSDSVPVMTLDDNPAVLSRYVFQEVDIMDVLKDLYDQKLSAQEVQEVIVQRATEWIDTHAVEASDD